MVFSVYTRLQDAIVRFSWRRGILTPSLPLRITGTGIFGEGSILYASVARESVNDIKLLSDAIIAEMGSDVASRRDDHVFHMTLANAARDREFGAVDFTGFVDREYEFGTELVKGLASENRYSLLIPSPRFRDPTIQQYSLDPELAWTLREESRAVHRAIEATDVETHFVSAVAANSLRYLVTRIRG